MTTVIIEVRNNSVYLVNEDEYNPESACSFLLVLMIVTILVNSFLVVTILRSSLRVYTYNVILLSLCLSLILDAGLNLAMGAIIRASWSSLFEQFQEGSLRTFCQLNASSMQWPCFLQIYFLALLSIHRSLVLETAGKHSVDSALKLPNFKIIGRLVGFAWLLSPLAILPLALGAVDCGHFLQRYSCSPVDVAGETLSAILAPLVFLFGYCLPWAILLFFWTSLIVRVSKERRRLQMLELVALQRAAAQSSPLRGISSPLGFSVPSWSQIWGVNDSMTGEGYQFFLLDLMLTCSHAVLLLPHSVFVIVTSFYSTYSREHEGLFSDGTSFIPENLKPISTSIIDNTLTWMRFLYPLAAPITIIIGHRELRQQCFNLFFSCKRSNNVHVSNSSLSGYLFSKKATSKKRRSKFTVLDDVKTPIVFATGEGLYLRTAAIPYTGLNSFHPSFNATGIIEPRFVSVFTDIALVQTGKNFSKMSKSPKMSSKNVRNIVESLEDDINPAQEKKTGKSVRFAKNVSEIPLSESSKSNSSASPSIESAVVTVRPAPKLRMPDRKLITPKPKKSSDPFELPAKLNNVFDVKDVGPSQSLANMLADSASLASSSSSSLLLSLSQRMRNRNS